MEEVNLKEGAHCLWPGHRRLEKVRDREWWEGFVWETQRSRCMWGGWSWSWIQDLESTWDVAVGELWTKWVTGLYCGSVGSRYQLENAATQGNTWRTRGVGGFKITAERKVIRWKRERGQRGSTGETVLPFTLVVEKNAETHAYIVSYRRPLPSSFRTLAEQGDTQ